MFERTRLLAATALLLCIAAAPARAGDQRSAWNAVDKQAYTLGVYDGIRAAHLQEPDTALPFFGDHDKAELITEAIAMVGMVYDAGNGYEILPPAHIIQLFWNSARDKENWSRTFKMSLDEAVQDHRAYVESGGK